MLRPTYSIAAAALIGAIVAAGPARAQAQEWAPALKAERADKAEPVAKVPAVRPSVGLPDAEKIVVLVRSALLTLNDALQTGNFTVMRDTAAPSFQAPNTAARLAIIFQSLTQQRIDLSAVAVLVPQLTEPPAIDGNQRLRLKGYFPGKPIGIDFDLVFEVVNGRWRLFGISVNPVRITAGGAGPTGAQSAAPSKKAGLTAQQRKTGPTAATTNPEPGKN